MRNVLFLAAANSIHTARWVNAVAARGLAVSVASFQQPSHALAAAVRLYQLPRDSLLESTSCVTRIIRELRPDIVHAHYASSYGVLAAATRYHPTVLSVWGSDVFEFPERSAMHAGVITEALEHADMITSTSCAMAQRLSLYTDKGAVIIPFGIDLAAFKSSAPPAEITIGTVKALEPVYGIDYLLRAFQLVRNTHPGAAARLIVVGDGSQYNHLQLLAEQLGIAADTEWTGNVRHESVPNHLARIAIFVALSQSESFGVAVAEASACGRPVVATNVGGLPEVVEDGVTGYLVAPRDVEGAAGAISRLLEDSVLCQAFGQAGRRRIESRFDWNENVERMLAVYRDVW